MGEMLGTIIQGAWGHLDRRVHLKGPALLMTCELLTCAQSSTPNTWVKCGAQEYWGPDVCLSTAPPGAVPMPHLDLHVYLVHCDQPLSAQLCSHHPHHTLMTSASVSPTPELAHPA